MSSIHDLRLLVDQIQKPHRHEANLFYDKFKFKNFLAEHGIRVPETYFYFTDPDADLEPIKKLESFVLKPNGASSGIDVYCLEKIAPDRYREIDGRIHPWEFIRGKCRQIMRTRRSGGVLIEEVIDSSPEASKFVSNALSGLIDYRFYFLRNVPLYVKMRIPTAKSEGYSNTCRGSTAIFVNNKGIVSNDDTFTNTGTTYSNRDLEGKRIPFWDELRGTAIEVAKLFDLQFHSVDIVLSKEGIPCIIESEAIPWLSTFTDRGASDLMRLIQADPATHISDNINERTR